MSGDAHTNKKLTVPVLLSQLFDTQPDWNEMEFLIKWKGQSHLHCQWKSLTDLQNVCPNDTFFIFIFDQCIFPTIYFATFTARIRNICYVNCFENCIVMMLISFLNHCFVVYAVFPQLSGFKKVLNYTKKVTEEIRYRTALSREEVMFE